MGTEEHARVGTGACGRGRAGMRPGEAAHPSGNGRKRVRLAALYAMSDDGAKLLAIKVLFKKVFAPLYSPPASC